MKIKNKKILLAENTKYCRGFSTYIGLMFAFKFKRALIFDLGKERKTTIHMFFVFFPIDLIFLDKKKRVIELKENLKPFHVYSPKEKARYIIELNKGAVNMSKTKVGDVLEF